MVLDNSSQFKPKTHPEFSLEKDSDFHKEFLEGHDVTTKMETAEDEAAEVKLHSFGIEIRI